ncbi:MAG TPA: hypothetical protein VL172_21990, partial [Kofleriaceae bacterium]|nr:hypothetical protein [Kofleriaceae bacterium]
MSRPSSDAKASGRLHRKEADSVVREEDEVAEAPLFADSVRLPGSNADRAAMAARARSARADDGMAVDSTAADAASRAGMGDVSDVR